MTRPYRFSIILLSCVWTLTRVCSQPQFVGDGVRFTFVDSTAISVALVGDFNGWAKNGSAMENTGGGHWSLVKRLDPGMYQYKFLIDGQKYKNDPGNPALVENYNRSDKNSIFVLTTSYQIQLTSTLSQPMPNTTDDYPMKTGTKPVYLNIIWHQHQPLYVDPDKDQLQGPWVRTHATKDYYDMAAMLQKYPDVHCTINLTSSLLLQLREYYVNRLKPFVDAKRSRINVAAFWRKWKGKTDPWIDLALKPTEKFDSTDKALLYERAWNAFGISEVMIDRFPQYAALKAKLNVDRMPGFDIFTTQELREIKFWFYLAYFDPDFLLGSVKLPDGSVVDLTDYVEFRSDKRFYLKKKITEADCQRMVAEAYKVMANIVPIHKKLRYDPVKHRGQVEIITTPYYHPILPLIYDSDLAGTCQPTDPRPTRFSYPEDANAQVAKAVKMYTEIFGAPPSGMWPGEGAVAQPVLEVFSQNGITWTASDVRVLAKSTPPNQPNTTPYAFYASNKLAAGGMGPLKSQEGPFMALVFRETELSDRIGFKYQTYKGEDAAEDFVQTILSRAPGENEPDVLITVILDGENAWEWYRQDMDGKEFLNALYHKLSKAYSSHSIITTSTSEYLIGNSSRGIKPHPIGGLPKMERLWPGSWINGNFDTWIGEPEENRAWEYLLRTREDLGKSGITRPDPTKDAPRRGTKAWQAYSAWEEMYAAEGSDWYWWFGNDQSAPGGDKPFDDAFRIHLNNVYKSARLAGADIMSPGFDPIVKDGESGSAGQGTMAQSLGTSQLVTFTCNAKAEKVVDALYIVGSTPELGSWTPNSVRMYDDGTHGDLTPNDGVWSLQIAVSIGEEIQYKYTNSGRRGEWVPGEEFSGNNRSYRVAAQSSSVIFVNDTFGKH